MTYRTNLDGNTCVLQIRGELDAVSVPEIRAELDRVVDERHRNVIVDLADLRVIDSSGVGALVSLYKRVRAAGGLITVTRLRDQPLAILRLLKLDRVLAPQAAAAA